MKLIYLHGFGSDGNGEKPTRLREMYPEIQVVSPSLNHDPKIAKSQIYNVLQSISYQKIIIGISLGGFYAVYFAAMHSTPAFIINPVTSVEVMRRHIGSHVNNNNNSRFNFSLDNLHALLDMQNEIISANKNDFLFNVCLGKNDEVLTYENIDALIPKRRVLLEFDGETHRFANIQLINPALDEYIKIITQQTTHI